MSWTARIHGTRADADRVAADDGEWPGVLAVSETLDGRWRVVLYTDDAPDADTLAALRALVPGAREPVVERLPDADWVTLSQAGLEPVDVGRFHIHTRERPGAARPGQWDLEISAGLAFGTGRHDTTTGCLEALQLLARRRRFGRVLDLGTGTAVLAMAAAKLWPRAAVVASDIDRVAVRVARENARLNGFATGRGRGRIELARAGGLDHPRLRAGRFDLIVANVLAGPLVMLAPAIVAALKPGGVVVLAGLLNAQAGRVNGAYAARRMARLRVIGPAGWPVLMLERRGAMGARRGTAGRRPTRSAW